jgi:hypothetical protein
MAYDNPLNEIPEMNLSLPFRSLAFAVLFATCLCGSTSAETLQVEPRIDWPKYFKRLDPVSETLPANFDEGTSVGNGMLGMTFYRDGGENRLRFDIGRGDVTDHRPLPFSNEVGRGRLPVGYFSLTPAGKILDGEARIDIWNAETRGSVRTDRGRITFRAFCHAKENVMVVDLDAEGGEKDARLEWHPAQAKPDGVAVPDSYEPNPPVETRTSETGLTVSHQKLLVGGDYATAIQEVSPRPGAKRYFISICNFVADAAPADAAARNVAGAAAKPFDEWLASHRAWWHAYYPASFVSIPDIRIESFYWMQLYRLASATRADGMPIDTSGPWLRTTMWPMWWWDYNIQTAYYPVYAANQLHLGESLTRLMDKNMDNFILNVPEKYRHDSAGINGHSGLDCRCDVDQRFEYNFIGCLPYACHNYWLQYRYSMDPEVLRRLFPLLRRSINFYRHLLEEREDGKLHLPATMSPEYGVTRNANFDLALLRWGCERLIETCAKLGIDDPLIPEWKKILERLADYPRDENGYRIGEDVPVLASHRHSSHIFNIYPLYLVNWDQKENREVIEKSVDHWINVGEGPGKKALEEFSARLTKPMRFNVEGCLSPWSWAAASSMYSSFGNGEKALFYLDKYLNSSDNIRPNTQYIEGFPVIESGFVGAKAVQDMMLQSWGRKLRVFRGVPPTWKDAVFYHLRGEGAFLVSAERRAGKLRWVSIKSEAGEPCLLSADLAAGFAFQSSDPEATCRRRPDGDFEIHMPKGAEVFLFNAGEPHTAVVQPLPASGTSNPWGVKKPENAGAAKFSVRDFGAVPDDAQADGEAIRTCIAAAQATGKPAEVVYEAGTYRVDPAPPVDDELVSLPVRDAWDLTLRGAKDGTTLLVFTNPSATGVLFDGCTNVAIRDLHLDYDPLPYASGTIASVDAKGGTFDLDLEEGSLAFDHPVFLPENAKTVWGMTVRPDPVHGTIHYGPNIIGGGAKISPVKDRRWRLGTNFSEAAAVAELKPGMRLVQMARTYGYGVCFRNSTNVLAEGVTVLASPGLAFLPILCGGEIAFVDCHVRVVPGRPLSTNADGIHARGLRGKILIERCSFEGMADDAINIHSSAILVQNIVSPSEIIAPNHTWSLRPGDELIVMDSQTLAEKGRTTVASAEPGPGSTRIRFTKPVEGLKAGSTFADSDRIYNLSEAGSPFVIRDCEFLSFRGRGILASSTGGIIERNRFENNEGWGIDLGFGERIWGEGPPPGNIIIADNEFIGKGGIQPAINVRVTIDFTGTTKGPREADLGIRPFRNLTIRDNTFENLSAPAIRLGGVEGALIENNRISRDQGAAQAPLKTAAVSIDNSSGVVLGKLDVDDLCFSSDLELGPMLDPGSEGIRFDPAALRIVDQRK